KVRRAIAFHFTATLIFEQGFGARHVGEELSARLTIGVTVIPAVRRKLVAHSDDGAHDAWIALGNPAKRKESRAGVGFRQKRENAVDVGFDPTVIPVPILAVDHTKECRDLEIILDVYAERICARKRGWGRAGVPARDR